MRTRIRRITATTAAGDGSDLGIGGRPEAIRHFPEWGLAPRVPIFICGRATSTKNAAQVLTRGLRAPRPRRARTQFLSADRRGGSKTRPSNNAKMFPSDAKTVQLSGEIFIKL
jgi:hypothetical protein